jgi:glycerate 2-kinase
MIIKNTSKLLSHGDVRSRKICLDLIEVALRSVDLFRETKLNFRVKDDALIAAGQKFKIPELDRIVVIGAGKATFAIAKALDEILGRKITAGVISIKKGEDRRLAHIKVIESGHPFPDENSLKSAQEIVELIGHPSDRDLFICAITGGASSLLVSPADGISLQDKILMNELLLNSGAPINVINSVRNHVSKIKGGNLALLMQPAKILNLIAIDEIEGLPWGPTVADRTTFRDSINFLNENSLWNKMPSSVRNHIKKGLKNKKLETPKEDDFKGLSIHNIILASNEKMLDAVLKEAKKFRLNGSILSSRIQGESSEAGRVLGSIAAEVRSKGRPLPRPCVLIAGGETTVKIEGRNNGKGGPSQEFVLGAALAIAGYKNTTIASIDTDGTDGPTDVAGAICDGNTLQRARNKLHEDIVTNLSKHSSYQLLRKLEDTIKTGPTETNVMDLDLAVIL